MDKEHSGIIYDELQLIRVNSSVRRINGNDRKENPYPLYFLDEVMENINACDKRLVLGTD